MPNFRKRLRDLILLRNMNSNTEHCKFRRPFNAIVAGPSASGKTYFIRQLLANHRTLFLPATPALKVLWCYGIDQSLYHTPVPNVEIIYREGLVSDDTMTEIKPDVIIIDDLMCESGNNKELEILFTRTSHHHNISVIFVVQNLFHQGKFIRTVSLNSHYIVLMKNARDRQQVARLGSQIMPRKSKLFTAIYEDATKEPYSNLVVDLHPLCPDKLRMKSLVFVKGAARILTYTLR